MDHTTANEGMTVASYGDTNFSTEMNRYRALELAIRSDFAADPETVVERARKYAEFMTEDQTQTT